MKFILLVAFVAVVAADDADEIKDALVVCAKEFNVDVSKMQDEKFLEEMKTDHNFQCFTKCIIVKIGYVKENGDLEENKIKQKLKATPLTDDEYKEIKECAEKQKQEDICERISQITDCIYMSEKKKKQ